MKRLSSIFSKLTKEKYVDFVFILLLINLPFSEHLIIGLPIKGRPFVIDFEGGYSISIYDLCFTAFAILCIPNMLHFIKKKEYKSIYLIWWLPLIALTFLLFYKLKPELPFLSQLGPIVFRNFLHCVLLTALVGVYLRTKALDKIFSVLLKYYYCLSIGFGILAYIAIMQFDFFERHYPWQKAFYLCFPFSTQSRAALFLSLCIIGLVGVAVVKKQKPPFLLSLPILLLSLSLTGSRSGFMATCGALLGFIIVYLIFYVYVTERNRNAYVHPIYILVGILIGSAMMIGFSKNNYSIRKSISSIDILLTNPNIVVEGDIRHPRYYGWKIVLRKLYGQEGEKIFDGLNPNDPGFLIGKNWAAKVRTHNCYLDFFYFVGIDAGLLFLYFILSLIISFGFFVLNKYREASFPFYFSIFMQLMIFSTMIYYTPMWRDKSIWIVIGLATAIMTHPELNICSKVKNKFGSPRLINVEIVHE